jgi:hypothetical protein
LSEKRNRLEHYRISGSIPDQSTSSRTSLERNDMSIEYPTREYKFLRDLLATTIASIPGMEFDTAWTVESLLIDIGRYYYGMEIDTEFNTIHQMFIEAQQAFFHRALDIGYEIGSYR